jgi:membrane protease YdiL (CAAX protease family)
VSQTPARARSAAFAIWLALTFLFTWALLPWAQSSIAVSLIALCGPAVAAGTVALLGIDDDRHGLKTRLTEWRVRPRWYVLALTLPVAISLVRSGVEHTWGARGAVHVQTIAPLSVIVFVLVAGEEIGWRGFALPRLLRRFGPWIASVILGVIWAVWHLPLFRMPGMPQYGSPFPAFVIYTISLSVILTFLALGTRGSVIIATLFHGAVNTFGFVNTAAHASMRGWSNAVSYGLVALVVVAVSWHPRPASAMARGADR